MSNTLKNIQIILDLPGNRKCADCGDELDEDTGWASLNLGVVMCIQCAGIHRAMGTHITKIRSFRLDTNAWTDKITAIFQKIGGNTRANHAVWEHNLPSFWVNPKVDVGDAIRKEFVVAKYEKQAFLPPDQLRGRVNQCIKKMPIDVRSTAMDFWSRGDKKYKNNQFAVIHSRWLSRYTSPKKTKCAQQVDLTHVDIKIEENTTGFEEYDGYEFSLYEKQAGLDSNPSSPNSDHLDGTDSEMDPLLRCRIKDFKQFCMTVKDIRSTMAYYRVYDQLFEAPLEDPSLTVTLDDVNDKHNKLLGFAKMGWSKRFFASINGFVYQFKEDIGSVMHSADLKPALSAWDLQSIDCVLDEGGQRSGHKYAVLILNGDKTIALKFGSGPEAVQFYSALKQQWTANRGKYYVDFGVDPPEISGDATSPIMQKKKSSFFMPNPQSGGALTPAKEQDALILSLIEEYERNNGPYGGGEGAGDDTKEDSGEVKDDGGEDEEEESSEYEDDDEDSNMEYEDSDKFEISETDDDPLYRQVSQMDREMKEDLGIRHSGVAQQSAFDKVTGLKGRTSSNYNYNAVPMKVGVPIGGPGLGARSTFSREMEHIPQPEESPDPANINSSPEMLSGGDHVSDDEVTAVSLGDAMVEQEGTAQADDAPGQEQQQQQQHEEVERLSAVVEASPGQGVVAGETEMEEAEVQPTEADNEMSAAREEVISEPTEPVAAVVAKEEDAPVIDAVPLQNENDIEREADEDAVVMHNANDTELLDESAHEQKTEIEAQPTELESTADNESEAVAQPDAEPEPEPQSAVQADAEPELEPASQSAAQVDEELESNAINVPDPDPEPDAASEPEMDAELEVMPQQPVSEPAGDDEAKAEESRPDGAAEEAPMASSPSQPTADVEADTEPVIQAEPEQEPQDEAEPDADADADDTTILAPEPHTSPPQTDPDADTNISSAKADLADIDVAADVAAATNSNVFSPVHRRPKDDTTTPPRAASQPEIASESKQNSQPQTVPDADGASAKTDAAKDETAAAEPEIVSTSNISVSALLSQQKPTPAAAADVPPPVKPEKKGQTAAMQHKQSSAASLSTESRGMLQQYQLFCEFKAKTTTSTSWVKTPSPKSTDPFSEFQTYQSWRLKHKPQTPCFNKQMTFRQFEQTKALHADTPHNAYASASASVKAKKMDAITAKNTKDTDAMAFAFDAALSKQKQKQNQNEQQSKQEQKSQPKYAAQANSKPQPKPKPTSQSASMVTASSPGSIADRISALTKAASPTLSPAATSVSPKIADKMAAFSLKNSNSTPNTRKPSAPSAAYRRGNKSAAARTARADTNTTGGGGRVITANRNRKVSDAIAKRISNFNQSASPKTASANANTSASPNSVGDKISSFNLKNSSVAEAASPKVQSTQPRKRKRRKKKRKRSKSRSSKAGGQKGAGRSKHLSKQNSTVSASMSHLKLVRWFLMDKKQVAQCNNPAFIAALEKELSRLAILSVKKERKYVKVQISRRIPLPQRQQHWTRTMEALQKKLGGSKLLSAETIIAD